MSQGETRDSTLHCIPSIYFHVLQAAGTSAIWNNEPETTAMCDNKLGTTVSGLVRSRTRYEALLNQSCLVWLEAWNSYPN